MGAAAGFADRFPELSSSRDYDPAQLDLDAGSGHPTWSLVHEWNEPALAARIGGRRAGATITRCCSTTPIIALRARLPRWRGSTCPAYDAVLAFGEVITQTLPEPPMAAWAWTWHEAADTPRFTPAPVLAS